VIVPAKEFTTFPDRLATAAVRMLEMLTVPPIFREQEAQEMATWVLAKTNPNAPPLRNGGVAKDSSQPHLSKH
jgi:hypothetical protein